MLFNVLRMEDLLVSALVVARPMGLNLSNSLPSKRVKQIDRSLFSGQLVYVKEQQKTVFRTPAQKLCLLPKRGIQSVKVEILLSMAPLIWLLRLLDCITTYSHRWKELWISDLKKQNTRAVAGPTVVLLKPALVR
jgi:hypothetical protein